MDGLNSFYDTDAGLDRLVRTESTAMIVDGPIHSFKEYKCQVHYKLTLLRRSLVHQVESIFAYVLPGVTILSILSPQEEHIDNIVTPQYLETFSVFN